MNAHTLQQPSHYDTPPPISPKQPFAKNKLLIIAGVLVTVTVLGVTAWLFSRHAAQSTQTKTANAITCSPPNTPTCGPDGHPVNGGTAENTSAMQDAKILTSVTGENIKLSGAGPQGLDFDSQTGYVYIANNGNVISGCEGDVTKNGQAGAPAPIKAGANTLSIVDPASKKELKNVATQQGVVWPLVDTQRSVVYTAGSGDGMVGIHKLATGDKVGSIKVGGRPHAFGLHGSILVVSNTNDSSQTYMTSVNADTRTVIAHQKAPDYPHGIGYDNKKNVFYMVGVKTGEIAVIDASTGTVKETFAAGGANGNSNMLAFSEKTRKIFISDTQRASSITVIDADSHKKLGTINFTQSSAPAWGMQVDDTKDLLYAALPNADGIGVADLATLKPLGIIKVDTCPYAVRLDIKRGVGVTTNQVNATSTIFKLSDVAQALGR